MVVLTPPDFKALLRQRCFVDDNNTSTFCSSFAQKSTPFYPQRTLAGRIATGGDDAAGRGALCLGISRTSKPFRRKNAIRA